MSGHDLATKPFGVHALDLHVADYAHAVADGDAIYGGVTLHGGDQQERERGRHEDDWRRRESHAFE
jgi:hypothetical protein